MPQAEQRLRDIFGIDESKACKVLDSNNWLWNKETICYTVPKRVLSQEEQDAMDYLFQEWDYGFIQ